jgi:hypothetical protein
VNIEISEGRIVWEQTVGVPDTMPNAGGAHRVQLLSLQGAQHVYLYCRIDDPNSGEVFCCYRLGHTIDSTRPQMQFDTTNTLHVLHLVGPKTYLLSQIGVNGEYHGQSNYIARAGNRSGATDRQHRSLGANRSTSPRVAAGAPANPKYRPPGLKR